jgi:hypothetical protein
MIAFRFTGQAAGEGVGTAQTILSAYSPGIQAPLWIGLAGPDQRLTVIVGPEPRRSPHYWYGPTTKPNEAFDIRLLIHPGMGPGGIMVSKDDSAWTSLIAASPWGAERVNWPERWSVGHAQGGTPDRVFRGQSLEAQAIVIR